MSDDCDSQCAVCGDKMLTGPGITLGSAESAK